MKKFLILVCLAFAGLCLSSCEDNGVQFLYNVTIAGDADGDVNVTFPDGSFDVNGTAAIDFKYGNVVANKELAAKPTKDLLSLEDALNGKNRKARKFAESTQDCFNVSATSGTYYVTIKGYMKESATGIVISIDKTFTNRENK